MKITIEITDAEYKGLKDYLKETSGDVNPKIGKKDVQQEVQGMVSASLQSGAVWDYISQHVKKEN